jgi:hypothetical protein
MLGPRLVESGVKRYSPRTLRSKRWARFCTLSKTPADRSTRPGHPPPHRAVPRRGRLSRHQARATRRSQPQGQRARRPSGAGQEPQASDHGCVSLGGSTRWLEADLQLGAEGDWAEVDLIVSKGPLVRTQNALLYSLYKQRESLPPLLRSSRLTSCFVLQNSLSVCPPACISIL